ncbi:MAG: serine/threonine-protein kinase [Pseudonocardiaceae bacterium]
MTAEASSPSHSSSSSYYGEQTRTWGPVEPPLEPGELLAPGYQVVAHLRRGHRLDVYDLWSDERGCRCVAKTLRPERAGDGVAAGRLRTEGLLLATLSHPHLVRGYETVLTEVRPRPAVLIETLPGNTVAYLVDEHGRLTPADAAMLGVQLCSVLGYLHRHGWVHLDVKPANVVEVGGRAVLLDLSVAARLGERDTGGTFDYLSPEQARGDAVTEAADVWGLGITLYEALSGTTPWAGSSHRERRSDGTRRYPQLERTAEPLRTRRRLPAQLARTVDACLDPDPADRPTVAEVSDRLVACSGVDPRRSGN